MYCCMSYSVAPELVRTAVRIWSNASALILSMMRPASMCVRYPSSGITEMNMEMRSADETILYPRLFNSSIVPLSTREM